MLIWIIIDMINIMKCILLLSYGKDELSTKIDKNKSKKPFFLMLGIKLYVEFENTNVEHWNWMLKVNDCMLNIEVVYWNKTKINKHLFKILKQMLKKKVFKCCMMEIEWLMLRDIKHREFECRIFNIENMILGNQTWGTSYQIWDKTAMNIKR